MSTNKSIADLASNLFSDPDLDATAEIVKTGSTAIYAVRVDNSANTVSTYAKLYNSVAVTVGTTVPDMVIKVAAGLDIEIAFPQGLTFATGLTVAAVTVGGTTGTNSPANDVPLEVAYT